MPTCIITGTIRNLTALWIGTIRIRSLQPRTIAGSAGLLQTTEPLVLTIPAGILSVTLEESASVNIPYRFEFFTGAPPATDPVFSFDVNVPNQPTATLAQLITLSRIGRATDPRTVARSLSNFSALNKFTRKGLNILFQDSPPKGNIFSTSLGSDKLWYDVLSGFYWVKVSGTWRSRQVFTESDSFFPSAGISHQTALTRPPLDSRIKTINPISVMLEVNGQVPSGSASLKVRSRLMRSLDIVNSSLLLDRLFTFTSTSPSTQTWTEVLPFDSFQIPINEFEGFLFENETVSGSPQINGVRQTVVYEVWQEG